MKVVCIKHATENVIQGKNLKLKTFYNPLSNIKGEFLKIILTVIFHIMTVNGDWSYHALKWQKSIKVSSKIAHLDVALA